MERREVIDRLLTRLPNFCERLSLFEFEQASECMLPEIRQQWTSKQLSEIWTNVASPLLLFAGCERLYMIMDYLEDNNLGNMLAQVAIDLEKVRAYLTHGDPEEQPVLTDRIRPARSGGAHRMTDARATVVEGDGIYLDAQQASQKYQRHNGVGLMSALECLRQLGLLVEVRLQLLGVYRCFFTERQQEIEISLSQQVEAVTHNYCSKDSLDHPILHPLAELLQRELGVLKTACKVKDARNAMAVLYEGIVLSLLDLRDAITAWQGANRGHFGQFALCQRMRTFLASTARSVSLAHPPGLVSANNEGRRAIPAQGRQQKPIDDPNKCGMYVSEEGDAPKTRSKSPRDRVGFSGARHAIGLTHSYKCPPAFAHAGKVYNGTDLTPGNIKASDRTLTHEILRRNGDGLELTTGDYFCKIQNAGGVHEFQRF